MIESIKNFQFVYQQQFSSLELCGTFKELKRKFQSIVFIDKKNSKRMIPQNILEGSQYQIMMTWLLEHIDDLECLNSTKYLAKTYLDSYLSQQTNMLSDDLHLLAISSASLAIKFNQSFGYPIQYAQKVGKYRYLSEEFIKMQSEIINCIGFNLNYITPYDYLPIICQFIPLNQQIIEQIQTLIDFSCTLKQLSTLTAAELFLGILMYLAYCYDPSKIESIKEFQELFPNLQDIVNLINSKAQSSDSTRDQA